MIIKKMAVGNKSEAFVEENFTNGLNIMSSDDNNKGKTIVIQSMMYALGNEPAFPTTFNFKKYYHYIELEVDSKLFELCRYGDSFAVKTESTLMLFDNVSELKRYWTKNIYKLPEIVKNQTTKIVDPVLFLQLHFVGQDKKDTSNISNSGLYNKKDFMEMVFSIQGLSGSKLEIDEVDRVKNRILSLKDKKKLLLRQYKILTSKKEPVQYLSFISDRSAFEKKVEQMEKANSNITELRKGRNLAANRKSKWENTIKELNSLNRSIDVGILKCMDCSSKNISFATSSKHTAFSFDISTVEMRNDIINSINDKIAAYDEEIEKYDAVILKEQFQLQELMKDENITLEAIVAYKEQIFSASDAEMQICDIEGKIAELQNALIVSENSNGQTKAQKDAIIAEIVCDMNELYKKIDPNGNLVFDGLFTKRDEIFSGSEATIFHIVRMYAMQKMINHSLPIIIDSFRAEDLSTAKERIVIDEFNKIANQVIFTTTLKEEEVGKYNSRKDINHLDYKDHMPSKILSEKHCERFNKLLDSFSFEIF